MSTPRYRLTPFETLEAIQSVLEDAKEGKFVSKGIYHAAIKQIKLLKKELKGSTWKYR